MSSPASCSPIAPSTRSARWRCCSWSRPASGSCSAAKPATSHGSTTRRPQRRRPRSCKTAPQILLPLISIFAAYIIMNGHLSAGGGFQGGAVIASGVMLLLLANPAARAQHRFLSVTESLAGVLFVLVGIAGLIFAGGFLDNRVLPLGQFGAFFSAGAIPVLLGPARHQGRLRAERHHRPLPNLSRQTERPIDDFDHRADHRPRPHADRHLGHADATATSCASSSAVSLIGTGTHIVIVAIGYVASGTAPIIDRALACRGGDRRAPSIRYRRRWS